MIFECRNNVEIIQNQCRTPIFGSEAI